MDATASSFVGLTPIDMDLDAARPWVRWLDLRGLAIAEPMFSGTVQRALAEGRRPRVSPAEVLLEVAELAESIAPTGFVFHGARAGSTLLAMLLRRSEQVVVLNEPQASCMAIAHRGLAADPRWLTALVACLGQRRHPAQRALFITFSSWAVLRVQHIQRSFPQVPCVFLYRDPFEVVASLLAHAPKWAHPPRDGLDLLVETPIIGDGDPPDEEFFARAIGGFDAAAACATLELVPYPALTEVTPEQLGAWFGIEFTAAERARMREALPAFARHQAASEPALPVTDAARAAALRWALPAYRTLETQRHASSG